MNRVIIRIAGVILLCSVGIYCLISQTSDSPEFFDNGNLISYHIDDLPDIVRNKKRLRKQQESYYKNYKPDEFLKYYQDIRKTWDQDKVMYPANYKQIEYSASRQSSTLKSLAASYDFDQRGPSNIGGRTRGIIYDPDDPDFNTWFVSSASGGVWKTNNAGDSWINLTEDLPNLSTSCIAMAPSNHDVLYVGTGEGYAFTFTFVRGEGIYRSLDKGNSWEQIQNTALSSDFEYVNRILVHPSDENTVIVTTNEGIIKTTDAFETWDLVFQVNDSIFSDGSVSAFAQGLAGKSDFSRIYATIRGYGIAISDDEGDTWTLVEELIGTGQRYEVAVSGANENVIYAVSEVNQVNQYIWISMDGGDYWEKFRTISGQDRNFLWGQGWYDMTIAGHPYNEYEFFVGGTNVGTYNFQDTLVNNFSTIDDSVSSSFIELISFGGNHCEGKVDMEGMNLTQLSYDEIVNVEIRFGPDRSQKAHRLLVPPQSTSGVPNFNYVYVDYVDVPFEVWDVDNNRQLMVSFRDQESDNKFNLFETTGSGYGQMGREYIFVHALTYDEEAPHPEIGRAYSRGTHLYKQLLFLWPTFSGSGTWDPDDSPVASIKVNVEKALRFDGASKIISDAYGNYVSGGKNLDLHPDHHSLLTLPVKPEWGMYYLLSANDGGIALSKTEGNTWETKEMGYITSQFYSAAKKRGEDIYIGGTQDNGSFISPFAGGANSLSEYQMVLGGDGFEVLWNYQDPDRAMISLYNNFIYRTFDGGKNWTYGFEGIDNSVSPFITRISSSVSSPDVIYAVGSEGVYKSPDFGGSWEIKSIERKWLAGNLSGSQSSYHNVRVSLANDHVIWAGAALDPEIGMTTFVSSDAGENFTEVNVFSERNMATYLTGIATHPHKDSTAYLLFSTPELPKILRTNNMGDSWEDISGFGKDSVSSNGFPDVSVISLLVMPHDPEIIWAGTEIGIFESTDSGNSWHMLHSDLPSVSIWQMNVVDDQIVCATFGRGIWTITIPELENTPILFGVESAGGSELRLTGEFDTPYDRVDIYANGELISMEENPPFGEKIELEFSCNIQSPVKVSCIGYYMDKKYKSNNVIFVGNSTGFDEMQVQDTKLKLYPNPATDVLFFDLDDRFLGYEIEVSILDLRGMQMQKFARRAELKNRLNIEELPDGVYIINVRSKFGDLASRLVKN